MTDKAIHLDPEAVPDYAGLLGLRNKVVVVAGAGQGIGRQSAHAVAAAGAIVVAVDIDSALAEKVAGEVRGVAVAADVTLRADVERILDVAEAQGGVFHGFIDIVGVSRFEAIVDTTDESYDFLVNRNSRHAFLLAALGGRRLITQGAGGSMVWVASAGGVTGSDLNAVYGMMKAGVINLAKSAAVEFGPYGIRANTISPGLIWTPRMAERIGEEHRQPYDALAPLGRLGVPADIAAAALYLSSDLSGFVTGHNLLVDGGTTSRSPFMVMHIE